MKNYIIFLIVVSFIGFSCSKEETQFLTYEEQLIVDTEIIEDFLSENGLTAD